MCSQSKSTSMAKGQSLLNASRHPGQEQHKNKAGPSKVNDMNKLGDMQYAGG